MINVKQGQYYYAIRNRHYIIYQCVYNDGKAFRVRKAEGEKTYATPEKARRRVYELNGWEYKPKPQDTTTAI